MLTTRFVLAGATDVLGVAYSDEVLGLGESAAGLIIGAIGIGGILGGADRRVAGSAQPLAPVLLVGGVVQGAGLRGRRAHRAASPPPWWRSRCPDWPRP